MLSHIKTMFECVNRDNANLTVNTKIIGNLTHNKIKQIDS